jgi:hypothetical protein
MLRNDGQLLGRNVTQCHGGAETVILQEPESSVHSNDGTLEPSIKAC